MTESGGPPADSPSLDGIDRLVHEPARLVVLATLAVVDSADAPFLLKQTGLTWGNLSSHLTKLEQAGYVEVEKAFVDRRPRTLLTLSGPGRQALRRYRDQMWVLLGNLPD